METQLKVDLDGPGRRDDDLRMLESIWVGLDDGSDDAAECRSDGEAAGGEGGTEKKREGEKPVDDDNDGLRLLPPPLIRYVPRPNSGAKFAESCSRLLQHDF